MRIGSVVRLHVANKFTLFGLPLIILASAFAFIVAIRVIAGVATSGQGLADMYEGMRYNGAIFSVMGPLLGFGVTAMGQYFPLATGLGLTRREFYLGTGIVFAAAAAGFAALVTLGRIVERATGGWWLGVRFFDVVWVGASGAWWQTFVQTLLGVLATMFVGAAITTAFLRWGQTFLWLFFIGLGALAVTVLGVVWLVPGASAGAARILTMGWVAWMGVAFGTAVVGAAAWLWLVRRAQTR